MLECIGPVGIQDFRRKVSPQASISPSPLEHSTNLHFVHPLQMAPRLSKIERVELKDVII
ncbi:hypothetical protein S7711_11626, partial [Stachybotrys chartarum IBT 7711]